MNYTCHRITLSFNRIVNFIVQAGIEMHTSPQEAKYIRFTNIMASLAVMTIVPHMIFTLTRGYYFLSMIEMLNVLFIVMVIDGNRKKEYIQSRFLYLLIINFHVLLTAYAMGHEGRVYEFFYIMLMMPLLLFSLRHYKLVAAGFLLSLSFLLLYLNTHEIFSGMITDGVDVRQFYHINSVIKFIMFGFAVFILAYYNYTTEDELFDSNTQLQLQVEELRRSNEELQQFDYIISHDLKAPVRNISSFMKLLMNRYGNELDESGRDFIELSKGSSDKLAKQIDDLISYCRIDRNLPPATNLALNDAIQVIGAEFRANQNYRPFNIEVSKPLPVLSNVHSSLIQHLFRQLISNGLKFNNSKHPEVTIDFVRNEEAITFSIKDNGIGMNISSGSNLFQMFRKHHSSDEYEGSGVGLALCKKIVKSYRGEIWFESKEGKGTTVFFSIHQPMTNSSREFHAQHLPQRKYSAEVT